MCFKSAEWKKSLLPNENKLEAYGVVQYLCKRTWKVFDIISKK